jgi:aquaporin related protein
MALAELVGTGMLIFLGCMGTVVGMSHSPHPHLLVALAFGLAVMICIQVSEHLPCVAPGISTLSLSTV